MKNPLFGIDVQMHKDNNTQVVFWRDDLQHPGHATQKVIEVHTDASSDRIKNILPPPNSTMSIWPSETYLSIDFIIHREINV